MLIQYREHVILFHIIHQYFWNYNIIINHHIDSVPTATKPLIHQNTTKQIHLNLNHLNGLSISSSFLCNTVWWFWCGPVAEATKVTSDLQNPAAHSVKCCLLIISTTLSVLMQQLTWWWKTARHSNWMNYSMGSATTIKADHQQPRSVCCVSCREYSER